jgi:predicted CXXCH cytochrome family protein
LNCHRSHHAASGPGLLTESTDAETCLNCHDGSVARDNTASDFRKPYRHPVTETAARHRLGERPDGRPDHVTCADCHDPHQSASGSAQAPFVPPSMEGVSGLTQDGLFTEQAIYEYEVCFKCHAEQGSGSFRAINRQVPYTNFRQQFSSASPSYHPVTAVGNNPDVPSLIEPMTEQSFIYCSHCHGGDSAAGVGLPDPAAPHGSRHEYMLTRQYQTGDRVSESQAAYALCYSCHDRSSILADESFSGHRLHVVTERTPCSVCHDPHGIDSMTGSVVNNTHLMNFDLSVVQPLPTTGILEYTDNGFQSGTCTLSCHGNEHNNTSY